MKKLFEDFPYLEDGRIILKRMREVDADALLNMKQSENVYRYLPTFLIEKQYDDMSEVIRQCNETLFLTKSAILMGIYLTEGATEKYCGIAEIYHYKADLAKVTIGYRLAEEFWGRGIATEVVQMMVNYLFFDTDVEMIIASHFTSNPASGNVLKKNGFEMIASSVEQDWGFESKTVVDLWQLTKSNYIKQKD